MKILVMEEPKKKLSPNKYRTVTEKVRLYPKGTVDKYKIDSLVKAGKGDLIGKPIQAKGQPDLYGTNQSDIIKKLTSK